MDSRKYDHGFVGQPIPAHSHIFGGAWYETAVKRHGEPTSAVLEKACAAAAQAQAQAQATTAAAEAVKDVPLKDIVKEETPGEMPLPPVQAKRVAQLTAPLKARPTPTVPPQETRQTIYATHVEAPEEDIEVGEIVRVTLEVIIAEDIEYYHDTRSGLVFNKYPAGGMGPPIGRVNEDGCLIALNDDACAADPV
jgi:hypothetical protein